MLIRISGDGKDAHSHLCRQTDSQEKQLSSFQLTWEIKKKASPPFLYPKAKGAGKQFLTWRFKTPNCAFLWFLSRQVHLEIKTQSWVGKTASFLPTAPGPWKIIYMWGEEGDGSVRSKRRKMLLSFTDMLYRQHRQFIYLIPQFDAVVKLFYLAFAATENTLL